MATSEYSEPASGALHVQIGSNDTVDETLAAEIVSMTLFDLGAQAVGENHEAGLALIAGFASIDEAEAAAAMLRRHYGELVDSCHSSEVKAATWVESQRDGLEPTVIGPWHIRAPWHPEPEIDPLFDVVIDPGVAFGHGAHPTTRLTIELMLRHVTRETAPGLTVVDLGTGTAVAAIIAARLGANVRAVEIDPDALDVAWQNIDRNSAEPCHEVRDGIELIAGDAAGARIEPTDLVLANVTLDVQRLLVERTTRAHRVLASGILCRQVHELRRLYSGHVASTISTSGEWAAVELSSIAGMGRKN